MSAIHVRGRSKPKRPLNAKPRTAAQQSQGASVEIRILRRRTGRGNITASGRAPGVEQQTRTSLQVTQARVLQRRTAIDNTLMLCQLKTPLMPMD